MFEYSSTLVISWHSVHSFMHCRMVEQCCKSLSYLEVLLSCFWSQSGAWIAKQLFNGGRRIFQPQFFICALHCPTDMHAKQLVIKSFGVEIALLNFGSALHASIYMQYNLHVAACTGPWPLYDDSIYRTPTALLIMHQTDIRDVGVIIVLWNLWYFDFAIRNGETRKSMCFWSAVTFRTCVQWFSIPQFSSRWRKQD